MICPGKFTHHFGIGLCGDVDVIQLVDHGGFILGYLDIEGQLGGAVAGFIPHVTCDLMAHPIGSEGIGGGMRANHFITEISIDNITSLYDPNNKGKKERSDLGIARLSRETPKYLSYYLVSRTMYRPLWTPA